MISPPNLTFSRLIIYLMYVIIFSSCSIYGHYSTNPKSRPACGGKSIILTKNNTFHIQIFSGVIVNHVDSDGNRIWKDPHYQGFGTFERKGDSLTLTYLNEDSLTVVVEKTTLPKANQYNLYMISETGHRHAPLVSLKDSLGQITNSFLSKTTSDEGTYFEVSAESHARNIGFDLSPPFGTPKIEITLDSLVEGKNTFKYKTYNGYYPKGSVAKMYCKPAWSGIRYGPKKRWIAKKYKTKWLNKFYDN